MLKRAVGTTLGVTYRAARRIVITAVGVTVVLVGVAMIVLPGPATLVIPLGLAILGLEFAWARRWLRSIRDRSRHMIDRARARSGARDDGPEPQ